MKKITYLNEVITYITSLSVFLLSTVFFNYIFIDSNIFKKIGLLGFLSSLSVIILWSLSFAAWATPRYRKTNKIIHTDNPDNSITLICKLLKKYSYTEVDPSINLVTIRTKNIITNWFYGSINIEKSPNQLSINCSNIIIKKVLEKSFS